MIKINLLPYRDIQKKEKVWLQTLFVLGVFFLSLVMLGCVHLWVVTMEGSLRKETEEITREIAELDKRIGQIDKIKSQKSEVERKLQVIDNLNIKRIYATTLLFKLAEALPEKLWLLSITDSEREVTLSGEAMMASDVSDYMEKLQAKGGFGKITLLSLEQQQRGDLKIIKFNLKAAKTEGGTKL